MLLKCKTMSRIYWAGLAVSFAAGGAMLLVYTPVEATMGPVQKIFYVHLPAAINAFLACLLAFVGAAGYLWQRDMRWDDLSAAAAKAAAILCTVVLVTGAIRARMAWGQWWAWTPRLTFSLMLWLLYVVYLVIRPAIDSSRRRASVCAVYAAAAFLDVPLVYLSVRLMPDIHPTSVQMAPSMKITLAVWFIPITLLNVAIVLIARNANRRRRMLDGREVPDASWTPADPAAADAPGSPAPKPPAANGSTRQPTSHAVGPPVAGRSYEARPGPTPTTDGA